MHQRERVYVCVGVPAQVSSTGMHRLLPPMLRLPAIGLASETLPVGLAS